MTQMTIPENSPAFAGTSQQHLLHILQNRRMPMGKRLSLSRKSIFRMGLFLGSGLSWDSSGIFRTQRSACVAGRLSPKPNKTNHVIFFWRDMNIYIIIYIYTKLSYTIDIYFAYICIPHNRKTNPRGKSTRGFCRRSRSESGSARGKLSPPYSPPRKVKDKSQAEPLDFRPPHGAWLDHGVSMETMVFDGEKQDHGFSWYMFFLI